MTAAWIAVIVIAVGLPLGAWWVGGRRMWSRLRPGAAPDPWREAMQRHHLTPQETARVEAAVTWGRQLAEPRLRRAAVEWAEAEIQRTFDRRRIHSRGARLALFAGLLAVVVGLLVWGGIREGRIPWSGLVWCLIWSSWIGLWATGPRRALRRNSATEPAEVP